MIATTAGLMSNCIRCGQDFRAVVRERVCPACKPISKLRGEYNRTHLSLREKQICLLVAQGKMNKEIGGILHLTDGSVKVMVGEIFRLVGVRNRVELTLWTLAHPEEVTLPSDSRKETIGHVDRTQRAQL